MSTQILLEENGKRIIFSTSREAANHLGVSPSCICYYLKTGKLVRYRNEYELLILEMEKKLGKKLNHNLKTILSKMMKHIKDVEIVKKNFLNYAKKHHKDRAKRIIENFQLVYGDVEGEKKYNAYLDKQKETCLGKNHLLYI